MKESQVRTDLRLKGPRGSVDARALFDTGASKDLLSKDFADRLGCYRKLPPDQQYPIWLPKPGQSIRVTGQCPVRVEWGGKEFPSTETFEVSPDLKPGSLIVGRPKIDQWDVEFTRQGPRPRHWPPRLELI